MWQPQLLLESELSVTHGLNARSSAPGPILGDSENFGRCGLASGSGSPEWVFEGYVGSLVPAWMSTPWPAMI